MESIAAQSLVSLTRAADAAGYPRQALAERAGVNEERLRDPQGRSAWDEYIRLYEALEALGATPQEFVRFGRYAAAQPAFHRVFRIPRAFLSARSLYLRCIRWVLPRQFPILSVHDSAEGPDRLRLRIRVPDMAPVHPGFFHYLRGCAIALSERLDMPPAPTDLDIRGREAEFLIHVPSDPSVVARLVRIGRMLLRSSDVTGALGGQQREIDEHSAALLRTRRNFQHMIERLPDAVLIHRDGVILYANAAAAHLLGLQQARDLVGRPLLDIVHAEDHERARKRFANATPPRAAGEPLRGRRSDRAELLLDVAPTQKVEYDEREASLTLFRDVTERRRLEEKLVAADHLSSLGAISASVAHELNNPLAYIALNLRTLERAVENGSDEALKARVFEATSAARHGVDRATTIVRDLNHFSRPEKDSIEILDLRGALDSAVSMLGGDTKGRARIARHYPHAARVLANRARLEQVFLNLLLNALQSFSRGDPRQNEIALEVETAGDRVVAEVRDNGRGIPEEIRPRIFDPLFTTKPPGEGTGLGLAICRGIVAAAGGTIEVDSAEGAGTSFRILLPRAEWRGAPPSAPSPPTEAPSVSGRILVIDDESALLHALKTVLGDHHDVETEADGWAALTRLYSDPRFDLILCDLIMSGLSGMDLHKELEGFAPELARRIVFMTGGAITQRTRDFLATTSNPVLEKPFHFDKLLHYVDECLAGSAAWPAQTRREEA